MDEIKCEYLEISFPVVGEPIGVKLQREDGGQFLVILSRKDAVRLRDGLGSRLGATAA